MPLRFRRSSSLVISILALLAAGGCGDSHSGSLSLIAGALGGAGSADGVRDDARFNLPYGVASDGMGNLYVADTYNHIIRKVVLATGKVTTLAGKAGQDGSTDAVGANARFNSPQGIAADRKGNLYVADTENDTIRKVIVTTGEVTTVAGQAGQSGSTDESRANARFNLPAAVASDGAGNLYVADTYNSAIRKVVLETGTVTTLALTDESGAAARFNNPYGVAIDGEGVLFVADSRNNTLRKVVLASRTVTTLAGDGNQPPGNADGTGPNARFNFPSGVTLDGAGNLYVADPYNYKIRKVVIANGEVTTVAGNGQPGSNEGTGTNARFGFPNGVASDGNGNLFIADGSRIRKMVIATGEVTPFTGKASQRGSTDGTGANALFSGPTGVASDGAGNLFIADRGNHTIRKLVMATGEVTTLAGDATQPPGSTNGTGANARFYSPSGVALDGAGNLFVADERNHTIRKVVLATAEVTTLAGTAGQHAGNDGTGPDARFYYPSGLTSDGVENLFVADNGNETIRKVVIGTREVTTIAGTAGESGSLDETGTNARFSGPQGVAFDGYGNLFVADTDNQAIRKVVIATREVTTIGGKAEEYGSIDGIGAQTRFHSPIAIASDGAGNLLVADYDNHTIRKLVIASGAVSTIAGVAGVGRVRLGALPAGLSFPIAVAVTGPSEYVVLSENSVLLIR